MKRRVIKEFEKSIYAIDIMLYTIMGVIGYLLLQFSFTGIKDVAQYVISTFFIFGFFSLLAYFLNRRPNDYEFLFFGLINVCVGSFAIVNRYSDNIDIVISNSLMFYTISYFFNKALHVYRLFKIKSLNFIPKCSVSILVVLLTLFTAYMLYSKADVALMIYGYYFIGFGILSLVEVILILIFNSRKFRKKLINFLDYDDIKNAKKTLEDKKIKQVTGKRIVSKKVKDDTEDEIVPSKKKNKKIK